MNIGEKFLPVGTVLLLKGGKKRVMIIGLCPSTNGTMYDYAGCLFPEGVLDPEKTLLFNHDQIEQVFHMGLQDEEQKQFDTKLKEELNDASKTDAEKDDIRRQKKENERRREINFA